MAALGRKMTRLSRSPCDSDGETIAIAVGEFLVFHESPFRARCRRSVDDYPARRYRSKNGLFATIRSRVACQEERAD